MTIQFTKMHGLGNDFMVIDAIHQKINLSPNDIARLSRRDTGVGFDQCLLIESSADSAIDFFYRIFNADGHEVGQCGNGARCLARFVTHYGLTDKKIIRVATRTTTMQLQVHTNDSVTVEMQKPHLLPASIPMNTLIQKPLYTVSINDHEHYDVHAINVGNPHAVMVVTDLTQTPVQAIGQKISEHDLFPEQVNVGFMQIHTKNHIHLRVYERGCGETRACGSGAVAAMAIGRLYHELAEHVTVSLPGGDLIIQWPDVNSSIYQTGPAVFVYEGHLDPICIS